MNAAKIAAAKVKCADGGHDDQFQQRLTDRDSRGNSAMFAAIRGLDICICVVGASFLQDRGGGEAACSHRREPAILRIERAARPHKLSA
jgi:hypothetical protein